MPKRYPIVRSPGVLVEEKQDYVQPRAYPLPTTLSPPPFIPVPAAPVPQPEAPYTSVDTKQDELVTIKSAIADSLVGLATRQFYSPASQPAPEALRQIPQPPQPSQAAAPSSAMLTGLTEPTAPRQPLRSFTDPGFTPTPTAELADAPAPKSAAPPSQQILHSIGIPAIAHKTMAPQVARTFPKATTPEPPKPNTPPKTFRTTPSDVATAMKFSPLMQSNAQTGRKVVVSLPDKKVVVYNPNGTIAREYSVYIGKASTPTPRGQFRIMENIQPAEKEWYYGGHWLGFAYGYNPKEPGAYAGFHGWVYDKDDDEMERQEPGWKTSTGGCLQLSNKDVADLASLVGAGDLVSILDTPFAPPPPRPKAPAMQPVGISSVLGSLFSHGR